MNDGEVLEWLEAEYAQPFEGWDFSYLDGKKTTSGGLRWDYDEIVAKYLGTCCSALDIGTGGGEVFARALAASGFTGEAHATEGYPPNIEVARQRLLPLGATVHPWNASDSPALPFRDGQFDLITDRHSGPNDPDELARLLCPGGVYVTQQVGNRTNSEIHALLDTRSRTDFAAPGDIGAMTTLFETGDFVTLMAEETQYITRYHDVGALVYYLKCIPWEIPDFSVRRYGKKLIALHRDVTAGRIDLNVVFHAFLFVARRIDR